MRKSSGRGGLVAFALLIAAFALSALLALVVLGVRVASIVDRPGEFLATSGGEPVSIYNIMKAQRGLVLYEDPREPPYYATTLYNAGFYRAYAFVTGGFGSTPTPARLVRAVRFVTLGLALGGLAGVLGYAVNDLARRPPRVGRARRAILLMVFAALSTALGTLPGWWLLTARPDIGAAACAALALAVVFRLGPDRQWSAGLAGGLCLAAAWSFKQSCVLIFIGLVAASLLQRRYRFLAAMCLPVVATAVAFATLLGARYRYNVFFATSLSGFDIRNLAHVGGRLVLKGALPLSAAVFGLRALRGVAWVRRDERVALSACWWTCLAGGLVSCCRNGSELNYFFELWVVVAFLSVVAARKLAEDLAAPVVRRASIASALILAAVATGAAGMDASRLAWPARFGAAGLSIAPELLTELEEARGLARSVSGPLYCQPALSGLAWGPPLPAYLFDDDYLYFHEPALRAGRLRGGGLNGLIEERYFQIMILESSNQRLLNAATAAGYVRRTGGTRLAVLTPPSLARGGAGTEKR